MEKNYIEIDEELSIIFDMMSIAFIEIRACNDLKTCHALASVFHNVPTEIRFRYSSKRILDDIFKEAKHWEIESYINKLYKHSTKKIKDEKSC